MKNTLHTLFVTALVTVLGLVILMISQQSPSAGSFQTQQTKDESNADKLPPLPDSRSSGTDLPMHSILYDAEQIAKQRNSIEGLQSELSALGLQVNEIGHVHTEIVGTEGRKAKAPAILDVTGAEVTNQWRNRIEVWIPADELTMVAGDLQSGYFLEAVLPTNFDDVAGEGPEKTNADSYISAGHDCDGLTIGVIDGGYFNLTAARNNGDAPSTANSTNINYTSTAFENSGSGTHGTGVVEAIFDYCEDATFRIYKIDSLTDMGVATADGMTNGVDIFSHSLSRYNTGWTDDSGDACAAVDTVTSQGGLFFTSAGNRAYEHWQGQFNDSGSNGFHIWESGDETNNLTVPNGVGANYYLSWDTAGGSYDYDFYLYDDDLNILASSKSSTANQFESFRYTNATGATQTVHLAVHRFSGGITDIEVFAHNTGGVFDYTMAAGSTTSPSNCTHDNVIVVGAVHHLSYGAPAGSSVIAGYSSQGPSNSGMVLPDIAAPTQTTGFTYPNGFGGTSSATPNAAGATAALWSSDIALSGNGIRHLLYRKADIFKDWGSNGIDNVYGNGGLALFDYQQGTKWVDRSVNNTSGSATIPYSYVNHAQSAAPNNGRIVFLGQNYPETITLSKPLTYVTIGSTATLGE